MFNINIYLCSENFTHTWFACFMTTIMINVEDNNKDDEGDDDRIMLMILMIYHVKIYLQLPLN